MDVRPSITIDLNDLGFSEPVIMGPMSFRKRQMLKNYLGSISKKDENGTDLDLGHSGDIETAVALAYIRSAPFDTSIDGFLNKCDELDERLPGAGSELFRRISEAAAEIGGGKDLSPFVSSRGAENL